MLSWFQFHYGAIKTVEYSTDLFSLKTSFNSTMVRLKPEKKSNSQTPRAKFQFHYGAIKTLADFEKLEGYAKFQFHYGAIKTRFETTQAGCSI